MSLEQKRGEPREGAWMGSGLGLSRLGGASLTAALKGGKY